MTRLTRRTTLGALPLLAASPALAANPAVQVPIRMSLNRPWTTARVNGSPPRRFAIATAQRVYVYDRDLVREQRLAPEPGTRVAIDRPEGDERTAFYKVPDIVLGDALRLTSLQVLAVDLDADGFEHGAVPLLHDNPSLYDFAASRWTVNWDARGDGFTALPLLAQRQRIPWMRSPLVQAELDGRPLRLLIDTGSPFAVTLFADTVAGLKLWDAYPKHYDRVAANPTRAGHGRGVRVARAGRLQLGPWSLPGPVVGLMDPGGDAEDRSRQIDGRIGMDVLRRFALGFDPLGWRLLLRPNDELAAPFRHDRAGFQVARRAEGFQVVAVDAGSPAERAGLRVGDVVPGLTLAGSLALEHAASEPSGGPLELEVIRGGAARSVRIALADRL